MSKCYGCVTPRAQEDLVNIDGAIFCRGCLRGDNDPSRNEKMTLSAAFILLVLVFLWTGGWLKGLVKNQLTWILAAYAAAWSVVYWASPNLWPIAAVGFAQNVSFTFVSRGRNSGSLRYHMIASLFSNGLYCIMLFASFDSLMGGAKASPVLFGTVYTLTTMSGSIFAHWLAMRLEKGKGKSVQEDRVGKIERDVRYLLGADVEHIRERAAKLRKMHPEEVPWPATRLGPVPSCPVGPLA